MSHSAKGSEWEKHKYIKRVDGTYYYPDSYVGGRHLPKTSNNTKEAQKELTDSDREESAISGLAKAAGMLPGDVKFMFNTMKLYEALGVEELDIFAKHNLNVAKSLADYINGVVDGSIESTPEIKKALSELTKGRSVNESEVRKFAENEQINVQTFTYAMEKMYGDQASTESNKSSSKDNKVDISKLTKYEKDLIKSVRNQLSPTPDKKWDINEWDGKLSEGEMKLLKQINEAMGGKSDLEFLGENDVKDNGNDDWDGSLSDKPTSNLNKTVSSSKNEKVSNISEKQFSEGKKMVASAISKSMAINVSATLKKRK